MTDVQVNAGGSWICPPTITRIYIVMTGPGGGGSGGDQYYNGRGGYKGATWSGWVNVTPGSVYTLVGGSGGVGGAGQFVYTDAGHGHPGESMTAFGITVAGGLGGTDTLGPGGDPSGEPSGIGDGIGSGGNGGYNGSPGSDGSAGRSGGVIITYVAMTASITATPPSGNAPLAVAFTGTVTGSPTGFVWDFGDGSGGSTQNPSHTYTVVGEKTVTFTILNAYGSVTTTATVIVYWTPSTQAYFVTADQFRGP